MTDIMQGLLKEFKLHKSQKRRRAIEKKIDYYTGTSTSQYIVDRFSGDAFNEVPPYETNFTRKFVNKISRIYTLGAKRTIGSKTQTKLYESLIPTKDVRMKHSERMTRLLGTIANRVFWKDDKFEYRPVYSFECYFDEDPFTPSAIIYPLLHNVYDVSDTMENQWAYWDKSTYKIVDADGTPVREETNPYGVLPFVFTHREDQIDEFLVQGASDIVNCNEQVNIAMTEMQLGLRFNMFGQPWVNGINADQTMARAGSNEILDMGEDGSYNVTSPAGDVTGAIDNIRFQIELVALNNHLWVQWSEQGGEVPSGISLMIKDIERKEDYFDDIALWRLYEQDLYKVERAIADYNGISLPEDFGVDFIEVEYPKTVQDQILRDNFDLEHNLITEAKIMARENKDLTIEQAQKVIDENKKANDIEPEPQIAPEQDLSQNGVIYENNSQNNV